jgi:hypothetical protein
MAQSRASLPAITNNDASACVAPMDELDAPSCPHHSEDPARSVSATRQAMLEGANKANSTFVARIAVAASSASEKCISRISLVIRFSIGADVRFPRGHMIFRATEKK